MFQLYGDVTIAGEGVQNLGLCSALRALKKGRDLYRAELLWQGTSVFPVPSELALHSVASYDTHGDMQRTYSNPDPPGKGYI
jgi:hypothetical protein